MASQLLSQGQADPVWCALTSSPGGDTGKNIIDGTSLVAQWIGLHAPSAGGPGSITCQGTGSHMHAATGSSHAATKEAMCRN